MRMVLGITYMAFLDHLMYVIILFVMVLAWIPSQQLQLIESSLACLCGLYMLLWIPMNIATITNNSDLFVLCTIFVLCSFLWVFGLLQFENNYNLILLAFNLMMFITVGILASRGIQQLSKCHNTIALVKPICTEICEGPVWASWTNDTKDFPSGWFYEPQKNTGWGFDDYSWPLDSLYLSIS